MKLNSKIYRVIVAVLFLFFCLLWVSVELSLACDPEFDFVRNLEEPTQEMAYGLGIGLRPFFFVAVCSFFAELAVPLFVKWKNRKNNNESLG